MHGTHMLRHVAHGFIALALQLTWVILALWLPEVEERWLIFGSLAMSTVVLNIYTLHLQDCFAVNSILE